MTFVADGDTLDVNVFGDGKSKPIRVRTTGINAMEQTRYSRNPDQRRGFCHSLEATARLEQLINRSNDRVRLSAQHPSSHSGHRKRRSVAVRIGGEWVDTGQILIDEGHALHLANHREWAHNANYSRGAQRAAASDLRLWDDDYCGSGPDQGAQLKMWVNWDADGSDRPRYNGEWAKVKNFGSSDVSVAGWWFRDSHTRLLKLPRGAVIPAGRSLTVFIGPRPAGDNNRQTHFYWREGSAVFDNAGSRGVGDGGYLFDRQGDLRVWMMYPCRVSCGDSLKGRISVNAHPRTPEKVFLKNTSGASVDLEGYVVDNYPYVYSLGANTVLAAGERLRLNVKGSSRYDTRLVRHWGKPTYILNDGGDRVALRTQSNILIDCYSWGGKRC